VDRFLDFLGKKADRDLAGIHAADVGRFRDAMARDLSRNSANLAVKTLRVCFGAAFKQGLVTSNAASKVDVLKQRGECKRRPFTIAEIGRVLKAAEGTEWHGMVLAGLYTGARLGDIARLTWRAVDLQNRTLAFTAKKTGGRVFVPLAKPLADYLESVDAPDNPNAPLFPRLSTTRTPALSQQFRAILADAGLASAPTDHRGTGKGRNAAREVSELSFHSLRHSFVSILKATGANEAVAMALAGHETRAVSQNYTTLDDATLRAAVDRLPDVTGAKR
jgi:integrase